MRKPIETLDINKMTRAEFENLPYRKWSEDIGTFDSLVILPALTISDNLSDEDYASLAAKRLNGESINEHLHDSGFRFMHYVATKNAHPICIVSSGSDVLHIGGIGGYGFKWQAGTDVPTKVEPVSWNIDCLPVSGLLRVFSPYFNLIVDNDVSSFEVYVTKRIRNEE